MTVADFRGVPFVETIDGNGHKVWAPDGAHNHKLQALHALGDCCELLTGQRDDFQKYLRKLGRMKKKALEYFRKE